MRKQQNQQNESFQPEDYNEPTEPLEEIPSPLYFHPSYNANNPDGVSPAAPTIPAPAPTVPPTEPLPGLSGYPYQQPSQAAYPVLPAPLPGKHADQPPGGASPSPQARPARQRRRRRSLWPGFVRFFFILVQLTILARGFSLLFGVQKSTPWLALLFAAGDLFVQPVRWLAASINLSVLEGTALLVFLEFLVALLAYEIFSRLLARLLRALLD